MSELVKVTPSQVEAILMQVRTTSSLTDLTEVRARIEAAKAWARIHKQVKEMRLDLLRVEVEALVRVVQLGGVDTLPARDRKAARYLAGLSIEERATLVARSGNVTTATGMCRSIWTDQELHAERERSREMGRRLAEMPDLADDEAVQSFIRESSMRAEWVLSDLIDRMTEIGEPFTVGELADELIHKAGISADIAEDPEMEEGVREACRAAIRRQPVVRFGDGTSVPRIITAFSDSGAHVRIPVENAALRHLDQMIGARRRQLEQDAAALAELEAVAARLRSLPGAADEARIGDLLAADLLAHREAG